MLTYSHPWPPPSKESFIVNGLLHTCSQGILFAQGSAYFERFREDRLTLKIYIAVVLLFSSIQTGLAIASDWRASTGLNGSWVVWCEPLANIMLAAMIHPFFIWRCWKLTMWVPVPIFLGIMFTAAKTLATLQLVLNFCHRNNTSPEIISLVQTLTIISIFCAMVLDTSVTGILLKCFRRSRTGVQQVDATLDKLISLTWECAVPPTVFLLAAAVILLVTSSMKVPWVLLTCIGKLYCHAILRNFNSRARLREGFSTNGAAFGRISIHDGDQERENGIINLVYRFPDTWNPTSPMNTIRGTNPRNNSDGLSIASYSSEGLRNYYRRPGHRQRQSSPERSKEIQTLLEALRNTAPSDVPKPSATEQNQDKFTSVPDSELLMKARARSGLRFNSESTAVEPDLTAFGSIHKRKSIGQIDNENRGTDATLWERWDNLEAAQISQRELRQHGRTHRLGSFPLSPPPRHTRFQPPVRCSYFSPWIRNENLQPIPSLSSNEQPSIIRPSIKTRWTD